MTLSHERPVYWKPGSIAFLEDTMHSQTIVRIQILVATAMICLATTPMPAQTSVTMDADDRRAVEVINAFMQATTANADLQAAAIAVLPFVHSSLMNRDRNNLGQDELNYQFKKAHSNAGFYRIPVVVTRIQQLNTSEIGHPSVGTYERGRERKYWVAKREGVAGLPAPIVVFFPESGGDPKISYVGSL